MCLSDCLAWKFETAPRSSLCIRKLCLSVRSCNRNSRVYSLMSNTTLGCYFSKAEWGIVLNVHSDSLKTKKKDSLLLVMQWCKNMTWMCEGATRLYLKKPESSADPSGPFIGPHDQTMCLHHVVPECHLKSFIPSKKQEISNLYRCEDWAVSAVKFWLQDHMSLQLRLYTPLWAPLESEFLDLAAATASSQTKTTPFYITSH